LRAVRRFLQIVVLLLLLATGGLGWYLNRRGFSQSWREWIVRELRDRGAEVSFSRLTIEPFRGLVARDVKVYATHERKRVLARVNEMLVEANYARAARGEPFIEALTLVDASAELPVDPAHPDGPAFSVRKLNTRVLLTQNDLLVSRLDADVGGIHVSLAGKLANLATFSLGAPRAETGPRPTWAMKLLAELDQLHREGTPPRLDLRVNGDLAQPESIVVEADFSAEKLRRDDYRLESAAISAVWKNGVLTVPRFDVRDTVGRLQLSANFDTHTQAAEASLRSGIDLPALVRTLGFGDIGELTFQSVPQAELTARASFAGPQPQWLVFGRVSVGAFVYGHVPFDRFHADVSWDGRRWAVRDFVLKQRRGGELKGDAQQDYDASGHGDFRLGITSTLNPESLAPLVIKAGPQAAERLAMIRFYEAPRIKLSARGPSPLDSVAGGDLTLGHTSYRGIEAQSVHAGLRYNGRVLYIDDFQVQRTEGTASGNVAFDFPSGLVYLRQIRASVFPTDATMWVDPTLLSDLKPYRFGKKPPSITIDGTVDQRRPATRTRLSFNIEAPAMTYEFEDEDLHFDNISTKLALVNDQLTLTGTRGELFSGVVTGDATISINKAKRGHEANVKLVDVDFTSLTKLYFDYDESHGKLNGTYHFTGAGDDAKTMRGEGELMVTDGNVFAIPFLGPLSEYVSKIVPGVGYNKAHKGSAAFTVADGVMSTKRLVIEGKGFSMIGSGRIWFLEDRMDFDMRINARGPLGALLFPVSKMLEVHSNSKVSKPDWHLKVLPTLKPADKDKPKPAEVAAPVKETTPRRPAPARPR
jgi:hypothetical protein